MDNLGLIKRIYELKLPETEPVLIHGWMEMGFEKAIKMVLEVLDELD